MPDLTESDEEALKIDPECLQDSEFEDELPVVVVSREEWGALPPLEELETLKLPVKKVGISFNSRTKECNNKEDCIKVVQEMQKRDMEDMKLPDIAFSWMVGGDGRVYEGRGWKTVPNVSLENPYANFDNMIDVTYIGDFESEYHPFSMYTTFINFIRRNIEEKIIIELFEYK